MIQSEIMNMRNLAVIIYKEDNLYIAECPEIGTVDQGETIEAAFEGLKIATQLYLESFPMPEISLRFMTNMEVTMFTAWRNLFGLFKDDRYFDEVLDIIQAERDSLGDEDLDPEFYQS